jgi:hypothetical protein
VNHPSSGGRISRCSASPPDLRYNLKLTTIFTAGLGGRRGLTIILHLYGARHPVGVDAALVLLARAELETGSLRRRHRARDEFLSDLRGFFLRSLRLKALRAFNRKGRKAKLVVVELRGLG